MEIALRLISGWILKLEGREAENFKREYLRAVRRERRFRATAGNVVNHYKVGAIERVSIREDEEMSKLYDVSVTYTGIIDVVVEAETEYEALEMAEDYAYLQTPDEV